MEACKFIRETRQKPQFKMRRCNIVQKTFIFNVNTVSGICNNAPLFNTVLLSNKKSAPCHSHEFVCVMDCWKGVGFTLLHNESNILLEWLL